MHSNSAPQFTFSATELIQHSQKLLHLLQRDKKHFREYGIKEVTFKRISDLCNDLNTIPRFELDENLQKAKEELSSIRNHLYTILKGLENSVRLIFGAKSMEFRSFKFRCLHNPTECNLAEYAQYVVKIAKPRLPELERRHITEKKLDKIMDISVELTDSINTYSQLISEQEETKTEYIESANELISILNQLCNIGKRIWHDRDESLYQEYDEYSSIKPTTTYE
ncbi:hypothetical protein [Carboxylicivirga linearis]|uniref:Uncharacterized protein n=1 Tax=Carboxylicivirga linearis TaxID=1628157 RepID=A0ABS5K075_9BACT|nr:hypothetical protein [Carboxylicivirga linearis]MBS2100559.1 hypothetical protein [Carboxylicivirga linearis]